MRILFVRLVLALALVGFGHGLAATPKAIWIDPYASGHLTGPVKADGLTLTFSRHPGKKGGDGPTPILKIAAPGAAPLVIEGTPSLGVAPVLAGVVRMDPTSTEPQVLFMTYSGGAHCCTQLDVAVLKGGKWRKFLLGYDGEPEKEVLDSPAAGELNLVLDDDSFDYAFASHAGSFYPRRIYEVRNGVLSDVSGEARFRAFHHSQMQGILGYCRKGAERNGACAAYVAEADLAGEGRAAWAQMLNFYDHHSDTWPMGCQTKAGEIVCADGKTLKFKDFPHILAWFLWRNGYFPLAPSFPCSADNCSVRPASPTEPALAAPAPPPPGARPGSPTRP
jgi:hypothetical protein